MIINTTKISGTQSYPEWYHPMFEMPAQIKVKKDMRKRPVAMPRMAAAGMSGLSPGILVFKISSIGYPMKIN